MKKIIALCLLTFMLFSLCGCNDIGEVIEDDQASQAVKVDAAIYSKPYDESVKEEFSQLYFYGEAGFEPTVIWFNSDVTNLELIPVDEDVETSVITRKGDALCRFDTIKAGEGLVIDIYVPELIPDTVIRYTCGSKQYTYEIASNLRDGGILFIPVQNMIEE
ncbi:MAG: hypothetical protein IJL87_01845 [Clostridia bacterium]|nr:hypothetical protein [Clostridia bacterium]